MSGENVGTDPVESSYLKRFREALKEKEYGITQVPGELINQPAKEWKFQGTILSCSERFRNEAALIWNATITLDKELVNNHTYKYVDFDISEVNEEKRGWIHLTATLRLY